MNESSALLIVLADLVTWPGCCTPEGQCGALDSSGTLGCIPNASLMMVAPQACDYDPNNMCTSIVQVTCDGAEDCPGQQCCGHYNQPAVLKTTAGSARQTRAPERKRDCAHRGEARYQPTCPLMRASVSSDSAASEPSHWSTVGSLRNQLRWRFPYWRVANNTRSWRISGLTASSRLSAICR